MSMFLELSKVAGDSTVDGFANQIEVSSFSFSTSQNVSPVRSNSSHTDSRPSLSLFNFTKSCDKASPIICQQLWAGATLDKAVFSLCRSDEGGETGKMEAFITFTMEKVIIANYSVSGGGGVPYENVALNYSKIEINYVPQKNEGGKEGNISAVYDLALEALGKKG